MKSLEAIILSFFISTVCFSQTNEKIENLKTFVKVYGYVKYFHPSDEAANTDWDKFAIYGADKVEKCRNKAELLNTLNELFLPIAPTVKFYNTGEDVKFDVKSITPPNPKKYKLTYWQHLGVGIGIPGKYDIYGSVRINRTMKRNLSDDMTSGFGNVMNYLRTNKYDGKTIRFEGKVKLAKGSTGTGHLWLRVDLPNRETGFFDNMDNRPVTKNTWEKYEITGNVDLLAMSISFGCFLHGDGELLADDFHISYKDNDKWIEIPLNESGFETGSLTKVYKEGSWLYAGEGYEFGITDKESYEGKKCVSIKRESKIITEKVKKIFDAELKPGETINKNIGSGLSCIIPLALYCNKENTYPVSKNNETEKLMENVNKYEMSLPLRLGDVIITWNVFQHFFPYFDIAKTDWEKELEIALEKCYADKNENDFKITLEEFTAPLKDGHISVMGGFYDMYLPPIYWEFIEQKLVITKVLDNSTGLNTGDIVTEINGISPEEYFRNIEKRISAATPGWMAYRANLKALEGKKDSKLSIMVNNKKIDLIRSFLPYEYKIGNPRTLANVKFELLDNNIVYMNLELIEMKTIDSLMPKLTKARAIICDLRGYPTNNFDILRYLLKKNDKDGEWMQTPEFLYPDREKIAGYEKDGWLIKTRKPHLDTKIIFLTDGTAISAAESFMGFIEGYKLATIVGQPTAGTNGNVNPFKLPGNYSISWTGMKVIKHDGSQQHGIGILPNVYVSKTIRGLQEGRDEFLEKALEIANGK
jgi:C-terminal processing protease CtpA/Prc